MASISSAGSGVGASGDFMQRGEQDGVGCSGLEPILVSLCEEVLQEIAALQLQQQQNPSAQSAPATVSSDGVSLHELLSAPYLSVRSKYILEIQKYHPTKRCFKLNFVLPRS